MSDDEGCRARWSCKCALWHCAKCRCSCAAGGNPELVLNQLLKHTAVQSRFSANMVALVGAQPQTLTLKHFLQHFLDFRLV